MQFLDAHIQHNTHKSLQSYGGYNFAARGIILHFNHNQQAVIYTTDTSEFKT